MAKADSRCAVSNPFGECPELWPWVTVCSKIAVASKGSPLEVSTEAPYTTDVKVWPPSLTLISLVPPPQWLAQGQFGDLSGGSVLGPPPTHARSAFPG